MKYQLSTKKKVQLEKQTTTESTKLSTTMPDTKSTGTCNQPKGLNQVRDKTKAFFILHLQVEKILFLLNIC